jgi:O-antigen ligase
MWKPNQKEWRNEAVFICLVLMLVSLFASRALLSISIILFLAACLLHKRFFYQFVDYGTNFFLVGISLLFFIPFISGFWSDNRQEWLEVVRIKLPLLVFPVAFAGRWQLPDHRWKQLMGLFLVLVTAGVLWSLYQYSRDMHSVHEGYLKSKTILTALEDDHVRFSWMVSIGVLISLLLLHLQPSRFWKPILVFLIVLFVLYLHILSVRTGLITFYIVALGLPGLAVSEDPEKKGLPDWRGVDPGPAASGLAPATHLSEPHPLFCVRLFFYPFQNLPARFQ